MSDCDATLAPELDKHGRGQDIPLRCDKEGKHRIHNDSTAKANFIRVGKGGLIWPSK